MTIYTNNQKNLNELPGLYKPLEQAHQPIINKTSSIENSIQISKLPNWLSQENPLVPNNSV